MGYPALFLLFSVLFSFSSLLAREAYSELPVLARTHPVTIDGDPGEWKPEGTVPTRYDLALLPAYQCSVRAVYDGEALYLLARLRDDTPMINHPQPPQPHGADALGVRLVADTALPLPPEPGATDPARRRHLVFWYDSAKKEPVLLINGRELRGKAAGAVFRAQEDGYWLEARVPWKTLGLRPPREGQAIALMLEPSWATPDGKGPQLTYRDVVSAVAGLDAGEPAGWGRALFLGAQAPPAGIAPLNLKEEPLRFTARLPDPEARSVSLRILDPQGGVLRNLPVITREPDETGTDLEIRWDGLDNHGRVLPPGSYRLDILTHRGISQHFVASLHNSGTPPWKTDDARGGWGGDWSAPMGAASDGGHLFLAWSVAESGWVLIGLDATGETPRKIWGIPHVHPEQTTAIATNGEVVFMATTIVQGEENEPRIRLYDTATGRRRPFPFGKEVLSLERWPRSLGQSAARNPEREPERSGLSAFRHNVVALAVRGDRLASSHRLTNEVVITDWKTGRKLRSIPLREPAGLAFDARGRLIVAAGRDLWSISDGEPELLAKGVLKSPWGLCIGADGLIYVSDTADAMQVKVFDSRGKPQRTIGTAGGRHWIGKYLPDAMLQPAGLALDGKNRLWVAEYDNYPRRVSGWDAASGKLLHDFHGPSVPQNDGYADLDEPELINVHGTLYHLDYDTGKVTPKATLWRPDHNGWTPQTSFGTASRYIFRKFNGVSYAFLDHGYAHRIGGILRYDGEKLTAVASYGRGVPHPFQQHRGRPLLIGDPGELMTPEARALYWNEKKQAPNHVHNLWHQWTDANGDGILQAPELTLERGEGNSVAGFAVEFVDHELNLWGTSGSAIYRVAPVRFTGDAVPVYPKLAEITPLFHRRTSTQYPIQVDPDGERVYTLDQVNGTTRSRGDYAAVACYDLKGTLLWDYPLVWPGFATDAPIWKPGYVIGPDKVLGIVSREDGMKFLATNGYNGNYHILTGEGQWVATLCTDIRLGPAASANTIFIENFTGQLYRHPRTGKFYLMGGDIDRRIWEVRGFETARTARETLTLSDADAARADTVRTLRGPEEGDRKTLRVQRLATPGKPDWKAAQAVEIAGAGTQKAVIRLAWDDAALYARFEVTDPSPMQNRGDDEGMLFKTGDTCEVLLGMDPGADPNRNRPVAGDLRLLMSEKEGVPICVLSEAVTRNAEAAERVYTSPTGEVRFKRVVVLPEAKVEITREGEGYRLEARIPWAGLGGVPAPGARLRGDVGVLFSNEGGSVTVQRVYHSARNTSIINDIPTESRLTPQEWTTLEFSQ